MQLAHLKYPVDHIVKALSCERLDGQCWFSICGAGETLVQDEVIGITKGLLENGHFVNITTNGTLTKKFEELTGACKENIKHLHLSFSLHYLELKRLNLLDTFFQNVNFMRSQGASILVQINLCDEYMPYIEDIKSICLEKVGAYPQVALTRDESSMPMKIHSKLSPEEYYKEGSKFESPLFDFTYKNFNVKRKEFCYAGDWSGVLNLSTGELAKCYANYENVQNVFEDVDKDICFEAIGNNCGYHYCVNSSHFLSLGVIPSLNTPSYSQLRNRVVANWYSEEMVEFLENRLYNTNKEYGKLKKHKTNKKYKKSKINIFKKIKIKIRNFFEKNEKDKHNSPNI